MKNFLRKRWHGIPVGIISIVLAICLAGGIVYAAYSFLHGTVKVEVEEAITIEYRYPACGGVSCGPMSPLLDSFSIDVEAYPGEQVKIDLKLTNASKTTLDVTAVTSGGEGKIMWDSVKVDLFGAGVTVPGCSNVELTVVGTVTKDVSPGSYTVNFTFSRS